MEPKKFLTQHETAVYLGITPNTLYRLNCIRAITYYRCGRLCYYDINDIHDYIMRNKIPAKVRRNAAKKAEEAEPKND